MKNIEPCPVCQLQSEIQHSDVAHWFYIICPRCGHYRIEYVAKAYLQHDWNETKSAILSHAIYKMQKHGEVPSLDQSMINRILQNPLPKPMEQINNFVLWLGDHTSGLGDRIDVKKLTLQTEIGALSVNGIDVIVDYLLKKNFMKVTKTAGTMDSVSLLKLELTIEGWEWYENLKQGNLTNQRAFMAMQYGDMELDKVVNEYFRPAVKAAGFELYRLDDAPKAGLIDDRLKVEIRTSRFLIADLTHENRGAYWEAGFAQGLGKPVIYTCEASKFDKQYTHFDTNHHTTIKWDKNNLEQAAIDLKNTIRETLPDEAKLTDEVS